MRTILFILLIFSLLCPLWAQIGQDPLFQRVTQGIQNARELLRVYPNEAAAILVAQAETAVAEALQLVDSRQLRLAQQKLRSANDLLERALRLLSTIPTQRTREEIEEMIRRVEGVLAASRNQEAERLLNTAKEHLRLAESATLNNQTQRSLEHLRMAKFYAERCWALLDKSRTTPGFDLDSERNQYDDLLQKTREAVAQCNDHRAQRLLLQAQVQTSNIDGLLQRGEVKLVLNLYDNATRLLLRALDLCAGVQLGEREQLREELQLLSDQIAQLPLSMRAPADANQQQMLNKVQALKIQINQAIEAGHYGIALRRMELARTLLNRIWMPGPHLESTRSEQHRLQQEIERFKSTPGPRSERVGALLQAAERNTADAAAHLQQGRVRQALFAILAGNRFLTLAKSAQPESALLSAQQVENELQKVQEEISAASPQNDRDDSEVTEQLRLAGKLADKAREALRQNQTEIAREYINLANHIVQRFNQGKEVR